MLSSKHHASFLPNRQHIMWRQDKWRNLSASSNYLSSRHNNRTSGIEGIATSPPLSFVEPLSSVPLLEYGGMAESSRELLDMRSSPEYREIIYQAISFMNDPKGSDINAIVNFIEGRYMLPEDYPIEIPSMLRRLVYKGKIIMKGSRYLINDASYHAITSQIEDVDMDDHNMEQPLRICETSVSVDHNMVPPLRISETAVSVDHDMEPPQKISPIERAKEAALEAGPVIALTQHLEEDFAEGLKQADECAKLLEENESLLKTAKELHEKCQSDGRAFLLP